MASFVWYYYGSAGPAWTSIASNTVVFSGSLTDIAARITVGLWQGGTHVGSGDPGTDQCGANHARNTKPINTGAGTSTLSKQSGAEVALTDTNVLETDCTLRINFSDAQAVVTSGARFYAFDGSNVLNPAVGVDAVAWERGVGAAQTWAKINDYSTAGIFTTGSIGGDNAGERLDLADQGASTSHDFFICIGASPETIGGKSQFDLGIALIYS